MSFGCDGGWEVLLAVVLKHNEDVKGILGDIMEIRLSGTDLRLPWRRCAQL